MNDRRDYVALDWVKGEIDETLKQARYALEAFVDTPDDTNRLDFCLSYIHQVYGTLQMVEFFGAALLAEEMEHLVSAMVSGRTSASSDNLAVLMQGIIQLPNYLDQLKKGQQDLPIVILPLLNDLRAARGEPLLSETSMFNPDLSAARRLAGEPDATSFDKPQTAQLLKKLRQMYQLALLGWLRDQDVAGSLEFLSKAIARMVKLTERTKAAALWRIADAFVIALKLGLINRSPATVMVLRDLDSALKELVVNPAEGVAAYPSDVRLKNLLFYLAKLGHVSNERILSVQRQYALADALPSDQQVQSQRDKLAGPDREAIGSVVAALMEELSRLKDALDLMVRTKVTDSARLNDLVPAMRQLTDTMGVVGLGNPRRVLNEQVELVQAFCQSKQALNDNLLMDLAGALVYVEATLTGIASEDTDFDSQQSQRSGVSSVQDAVIREARNGLEQVKDAVVEYIGAHFDASKLIEAAQCLGAVRGGLIMVPLSEASRLIGYIQGYFQDRLITEKYRPQWQELDALADAIIGVEYYLERLVRDGAGTNLEFLQRAATSLEQLGITVAISFDHVDTQEAEQAANVDSVFPEPEPELEPELEPTIDAQVVIEAHVEENLAQDDDSDELIDDEILAIFVEEVGEVLETINTFFPQYKSNPSNQTALAEFRRAYHTLKGSGRMVGANIIGETAWAVENMLNRLMDGSIVLSDDLLKVVENVTSEVPALVTAFEGKLHPDTTRADLLAEIALSIAKGETADWTALGDSNTSVPESSEESLDLPDLPVASVTFEETDPEEHSFDTVEFEAEYEWDSVDAISNDDEFGFLGVDETQLGDSDQNLLRIFQNELDTHLEFVEGYLHDAPLHQKLPDALQRALHTIKGSAHMASVEVIAKIVQPMEMLVKDVHERSSVAVQPFLDLLGEMVELIKGFAGAGADTIASAEAEDFIVRVQSYRQQLLKADRPDSNDDSSLMTIFLSESMDIVMDAESLLESWRDGGSENISTMLIKELETLSQAAKSVDLVPVAQLSGELGSLYQAADHNAFIIEGKFFELAYDGHESLINMMDRLAAGQSIRADALFSERLKQLYDLYGISYEVPSVELKEKVTGFTTDDSSFDVSLDKPSPAAAADYDQGFEPAERYSVTGDAELVEIFLEEANDILESIQHSLDSWLSQPDNTLEVEALQRDLHTLKGGARMAEISPLGDLAHELEFLYEGLAQGKYQSNGTLVSLLQQCHDRLAVMVGDIESSMTCLSAPDLVAAIAAFRRNPGMAPMPTELVAFIESEPSFGEASVNGDGVESESNDAAASAITLPDDLDYDILEIFIDEAGELLNELENSIEEWQADSSNEAHADELKRVLHTLKGGARLAKLKELGDQSHNFESFVVKAQQNHIDLNADFFGQVLVRQDELVANVDALQNLLKDQSGHGGGFGPSVIQLVKNMDAAELAELETSDTVAEPVEGVEAQADSAPPEKSNVVPFQSKAEKTLKANDESKAAQAKRNQPQETVKVSAQLIEGLVNLAGETSIARSRLEQEVSDFTFSLGDMESTIERLRDQVRRLDLETEAQVNFRQERAEETNYEDFDPLEMDRYSQIQQLSRSLMEATYDLQDIKSTLSDKTRDAETLLLQQSRINTELQEGLMRTRMVPFNRLLPRLRRIVRQVAGELDKQVDFVIGNAEGEVDRTVLERMISPLEHMLRNAVDHGIEAADIRSQRGKPSKGTVRLDLSREGGDIVLRLQDDGKGIDVNIVRNKAIERGLIAASTELDENDIMQFILEAGFSTADLVTQISGRGVGMDVVNSEVKQLGGSMTIESELGEGTLFTIRLPFTVSVNRALMVNILDDLYALPLTSIEGIVRVTPRQLTEYYKPDAPLFEYGGRRYRLEYMGSLLNTGSKPNLAGIELSVPLVLVKGNDERHSMALHVDQLMGSREIVVKTLGPQFSTVPGVSGATILGDGSVVVILDLSALIRSELVVLDQSRAALALAQEATVSKPRKAEGPAKIMVCDDSVTVRKVTSRLLQRNGMDVMLAKHGADAITQMMDEIPDLILLDIEMPNMDGFEVAQRVRHDERLKHIPIIMITSRTGSKHRDRALSIGVNEYMGKPFQEGPLLSTIERLLNE